TRQSSSHGSTNSRAKGKGPPPNSLPPGERLSLFSAELFLTTGTACDTTHRACKSSWIQSQGCSGDGQLRFSAKEVLTRSYIFPSTTSTVYSPSFFADVGEIVSRYTSLKEGVSF